MLQRSKPFLPASRILSRYSSTIAQYKETYQDRYNAITTTPQQLESRLEIFQKIVTKNPSSNKLTIFFKKWLGFGKVIIKFYKNGLKNIWNNRKYKNYLLEKEFFIDEIDFNHKESQIVENSNTVIKQVAKKINSKNLTDHLLNEIYLKKIEFKKKNKVDRLINLNRSQYQLILRTQKDFIKLPIFAIIFLIFEECTPLICLFLPKICPTTCILPNLFKKLEVKKIEKLHSNEKGSELIEKFFIKGNVYELSKDELVYLHDFFGINFFRKITKNSLINSIVKLRNEVILDDYLINGDFEKLSDLELILCGNQRGLIDKDVMIDFELFKNSNDYSKGINRFKLIEKLKTFTEKVEYKI